MRVSIDRICLKKNVMRNILTCDSLTVYTPPKSSLRVFFSLSLSPIFFSSLRLVTNTHTYILVPFIIHDLHDGRRRLYLRRIRHSWLCVLEPNICVEKRLFFSSVVYPPFFFLPCLFFTFCIPYIYTLIVFFLCCTCIQLLINIKLYFYKYVLRRERTSSQMFIIVTSPF